jgi:hypothetical protein
MDPLRPWRDILPRLIVPERSIDAGRVSVPVVLRGVF